MEDEEAAEGEPEVRGVEPPGFNHSSSTEADFHKGRLTLRTVRRNVKLGRGRSLARTMHEPPAATVDMAVLPAVQDGAEPEAGMVCGAKRIRSIYLLSPTGVIPKLSTTTPPKGLASLSTINAAITPRRDAFTDLPASGGADLPASAHSSRLEAAPTAFLFTGPTTQREGRPSPRSRYGVSCIMRASAGGPGRLGPAPVRPGATGAALASAPRGLLHEGGRCRSPSP